MKKESEGRKEESKETKVERYESLLFCLCCHCLMQNYFIEGSVLLYRPLDLKHTPILYNHFQHVLDAIHG
jgi:hypothetical protein